MELECTAVHSELVIFHVFVFFRRTRFDNKRFGEAMRYMLSCVSQHSATLRKDLPRPWRRSAQTVQHVDYDTVLEIRVRAEQRERS